MPDAKRYRIEGATLRVSPRQFQALREVAARNTGRDEFREAEALLEAAGVTREERLAALSDPAILRGGLRVIVDRSVPD